MIDQINFGDPDLNILDEPPVEPKDKIVLLAYLRLNFSDKVDFSNKNHVAIMKRIVGTGDSVLNLPRKEVHEIYKQEGLI